MLHQQKLECSLAGFCYNPAVLTKGQRDMSRQVMIEALDGRRMFSNVSGTVNLDDFTTLSAFFGVSPFHWRGGSVNAGYDNISNLVLNRDNRVVLTDFTFIRDNPDWFADGPSIADSAGFGDANIDGRIDKFDVRQLGANFNKNVFREESWTRGDFTLNGRVDLRDFAVAAASAATK